MDTQLKILAADASVCKLGLASCKAEGADLVICRAHGTSGGRSERSLLY